MISTNPKERATLFAARLGNMLNLYDSAQKDAPMPKSALDAPMPAIGLNSQESVLPAIALSKYTARYFFAPRALSTTGPKLSKKYILQAR